MTAIMGKHSPAFSSAVIQPTIPLTSCEAVLL